MIRDGFDAELDELRSIRATDGATSRRSRQPSEGHRHRSLKVRFNKVFGYFIEVTKANLHLVPETTSANRRSPTANATSRPN